MASICKYRIVAVNTLILLIILWSAGSLMAQSKQLYTWLEDLTYLQNASPTRLDEQRATVAARLVQKQQQRRRAAQAAEVDVPPARVAQCERRNRGAGLQWSLNGSRRATFARGAPARLLELLDTQQQAPVLACQQQQPDAAARRVDQRKQRRGADRNRR